MAASEIKSEIIASLDVPGISWKRVNPDSPLPKDVMYENGTLNNDKVYVGRVQDGKILYIGTVIPMKGICIYLDKNRELKSSSNYEVLSVEQLYSTMFLDMSEVDFSLNELFNRENLLPAGIDETGEILYVARHVDKNFNFYYGWVSKSTKAAHIPRDSKSGQVLENDFGIMTHMSLEGVCICPPCPD